MEKFQKLSSTELVEVIGGKIIRLTPYLLYNTRTHKTYADLGAVWRTTGRTIVNGWASSLGR